MPLVPETIVYDLRSVATPRIAPDAKSVIYALTGADRDSGELASQLWTQDLATGARRQLTFHGRNSLPRWSHYSDRLGFLSDRNEGTSLMAMPFAGGEAVELTRHNGPITEFAWSVDGRFIAYAALYDPDNPDDARPDPKAANRPRVTTRRDHQQDMRGWLGDKRSQIWIVDTETKERRRVTREAIDYADPAWSPDGRSVVVKIPHVAGIYNQLGIVDIETGEVRVIGEPEGTAGTWCWSPDGTQLLIVGEPALTFQPEVSLYTVATGEWRRLTHDLPCVPETGQAGARPFWRTGEVALFHGIERARSGIYALNVTDGSVEKLISWDAVHAGFHVDGEGTTAVQSQVSYDGAGELVVIDLKARSSRIATSFNAEQLKKTPPVSWEPIAFERDGFTIEGFLLYPDGYQAGKRFPLVLDIHGGPANFYGPRLDPLQQGLAAAGFFVLLVNPRGSITYGREFAMANIGDWAGGDHDDLMAALDLAVARPDVDPERIGVYGYSYGGFMAAWMIGHTNRFKAAVIGAPVIDLISSYGASDIGSGLLPLYFHGTPVDAFKLLHARSPLTHLHNATTPTLILHGEADLRCPIGQSQQLFTALLDAGVETEFARYPGGGHLFPWAGPPEQRVDFPNRVIAWLDRYVNA